MIKQDITLKITEEIVITELTKRADSTLPHCDSDHYDYPYVFNRSQVMNRDLYRYYGILKHTFKEVISNFSFDEIFSLFQVLQSTKFKATSNSLLYQEHILYEIENAILYEEIGKNIGSSLLSKFKKLTHLEVLAMVDFVEHFMNHGKYQSMYQHINDYLA